MNSTIKLITLSIVTFAFFVNLLSGQKIDCSLNYNRYKKALLNDSTAPNYILVSVQAGNSDYEVICIEAPFLLGAIHREFDFDYSNDGERKTIDYALNKKNMEFSFQNDSAKQNIKTKYSQELLDEVISYFSKISTFELLNGPNSFESYLRNILNTKRKNFSAYRDATALLLLQRGILPTRGCFAGNLYVSNSDKPLKFIKFSSYIGLEFDELLKGLADREYEYYFIDEPPGKLIGCHLSFEENQRIEIYFRDISSQPKFNIDRNWGFDKLTTEVIESIKLVGFNK